MEDLVWLWAAETGSLEAGMASARAREDFPDPVGPATAKRGRFRILRFQFRPGSGFSGTVTGFKESYTKKQIRL